MVQRGENGNELCKGLVSGICMLEKFADTLQTHRDGILAYYDYPISK